MEDDIESTAENRNLTSNGRQITFEDLGIPRIVAVRATIIGNVRTFQNLNILDWILLTGGLILVFVTFGLAVDRFVASQPTSSDIIFGFLLLFNGAFSVAYLINGVFKEKAFEVGAFVLTTIVATVYVSINFIHEDAAHVSLAFKVSVLSVMFFLGITMSIIGTIVAVMLWKSGNLIFRIVGADSQIQDMCRKLFTTITLIHFDVQIVGSFVMLILEHGFMSLPSLKIVCVSLGCLWVFIWAIFAYLSIRLENKPLFFITIITSVTHFVYLLYFIIKSIMVGHASAISYCRYSAGFLGIAIHTLLIFFLIKCYRNFHRGLKEKVFPSSGYQRVEETATETLEE